MEKGKEMSFINYLVEGDEAGSTEIDLDEYIKTIKSKGLYGYNIFKHISEDELKKILADDNYFNKSKNNDKKIDESEVKSNEEDTDSDNKSPVENKLSMAVKLGLKKEMPNKDNDKPVPHVFGNSSSSSSSPEKAESPKPLSFADRMRAENERRNQERIDRSKREQEMRDQKTRDLEQNNAENEKPPITFGNKEMVKQNSDDSKRNDKINDTNDKNLTSHMFKRDKAIVSTDNAGYKKVDNLGSIDDKESNQNLKKEVDDKFPSNKVSTNTTTQIVSRQTNSEYSKRTLLAIADRMDFDVFCKFKKANGQIRTGNFRIGKSDSQTTPKKDTIIVTDLDLLKSTNDQNKSWRTIPLDRIISIVPI